MAVQMVNGWIRAGDDWGLHGHTGVGRSIQRYRRCACETDDMSSLCTSQPLPSGRMAVDELRVSISTYRRSAVYSLIAKDNRHCNRHKHGEHGLTA